ncbi:MAG: hypothetical protein M1837_004290 [Sclerophora amabilis]|nr:MAG: hypothetical protein M1837_004290 [Sclerophora amabilis]
MQFEYLANELVVQVFFSCSSVTDVTNLATTCHRFHRLYSGSQRLPILSRAAEAQYGPIEEAIQLITHNDSQPAHVVRHVPLSLALLKQVMAVGQVAKKWEDAYPIKKWKYNYEDRRLLTAAERFRLRRAIYRLWLYDRAFHNRNHPRFSRLQRTMVLERAELLHNWNTAELAEIEDARQVLRDVLQNHICPSNGTIQRKFRKRFPEVDQQLLFNIHLNYPPPPSASSPHHFGSAPPQHHHQPYNSPATSTTPPPPTTRKPYSKYLPTPSHEPGTEGWGDEIPHYYVVEDMLKLDPGQIMWLKENAPLKGQVEIFVRGLGEWFENNGETFAQTLEWVMGERAGDAEQLREAVRAEDMGIAKRSDV